MRGAITQSLTGPVVEQVDRLSDLKLADLQEVGLLGKVLAQQAIVILIETPLPGTVRVGKVHLGAQALSHEGVFCKLFAIVKRQRVTLLPVRAQQPDHGLGDSCAMA